MGKRDQFYEIRVEGHLGNSWSPWFEGMTIHHKEGGETVLSGVLADQAALHGVLIKIRDLGLPLVSVTRSEQTDNKQP
ncbi:MAG TPA: hypothetical protein VLY63_26700 [Anaerolineae bacterium]|nr:hypothetical protein [Anaerolineae bacterium]